MRLKNGSVWKALERAGVCVVVGVLALPASAATQVSPQASVDDLVRGAERIVVARVRQLAARWEENEHGDRLIVSRVELVAEETLKGAPAATVWMDLEGGTLDGLTLHVSSLPLLEPGERGVFFLERGSGEARRPFQRGQGILLLDEQNLVRGTSLHLNEIRARARALGGR